MARSEAVAWHEVRQSHGTYIYGSVVNCTYIYGSDRRLVSCSVESPVTRPSCLLTVLASKAVRTVQGSAHCSRQCALFKAVHTNP
jgi:hypothetical protein